MVAIESDETARRIARTLIPPTVLKEHKDILHIPAALRRGTHDLYFDTSPCQPWSRLNKDCIGFRDTRARPMKASMSLYADLKQVNPNIKLFAENVTPHHDRGSTAHQYGAAGWEVRHAPKSTKRIPSEEESYQKPDQKVSGGSTSAGLAGSTNPLAGTFK